jgi:predicted nucleotidyltransferase
MAQKMFVLPEKIRKTLERIVADMRVKEDVYGIGLFGSWSRGEASSSSDVDLIVFDKGNFSYEYLERIEAAGLFIDLDYVPKDWIHSRIPPEIDQKIYEMRILYDRDWSLANTKLFMAKSYGSLERVDIRTEAHLIDSDVYLSRATSAFSRDDFLSAHLFATTALEEILKVLLEIASTPFSNSHFVEALEFSANKLGLRQLFNDYLEITELGKVDGRDVKDKVKLFKTIWNEIYAFAVRSQQTIESSHFKIKKGLRYYLNPAFLQGTMIRTSFLIDSEKFAEASRYLKSILMAIIENYVWLKTSADGFPIDYTTLMRSFKNAEERNPRNYENTAEFLNLKEVDRAAAAEAIEKVKEIMVKIRKERKALIKNQSPDQRQKQ